MATKTARKIPAGGKVTFGTDPEFELVVNGKIVVATAHGYNGAGEIGIDGEGVQVEMRPGVFDSGQGVVEGMRRLFKKVYDKGHRLAVGSTKYAIGGHIHFGFTGNANQPALIQVLDDFLGRMMRPLCGPARRSWGGIGEIRQQSYGMEYRTLGANIFHNPRVASIVFNLAEKLFRELQQGDITYNVEGNSQATFDEYAKRIGHAQARTLFNFVKRFKEELDRCVKTDKPLLLNAGSWFDVPPAPDEFVVTGGVSVSVSGMPEARQVAEAINTMLLADDPDFCGDISIFAVDSPGAAPGYAYRTDIPAAAAMPNLKRRFVMVGNLLGIDRRLLQNLAKASQRWAKDAPPAPAPVEYVEAEVTPAMKNKLLPVGTRVRRGPSFKEEWDHQDRDENGNTVMGTVSSHDTCEGWVCVRWDNGNDGYAYRWGEDGKYDLAPFTEKRAEKQAEKAKPATADKGAQEPTPAEKAAANLVKTLVLAVLKPAKGTQKKAAAAPKREM